MTTERENPDTGLARAREALAERDAELSASRQHAAELSAELEETSRGLIALHAELEQARQDAARLAAIVEWSDDAMFSLTADGGIQTWNPGAERLLGYTAAEITGHPAAGLIPDGQAAEFTTLLHRAVDGEQVAGQQVRGLRKDGTAVDVTVTCSAMRDAGSGLVTGFSVVLHDITSRLAAEAELAAARAERTLLAERDRLARDLHDRVIQRIFAAGMSLHTAAGLARSPQAAARIEAVIADLDTSIDELRETIFTLRRGPRVEAGLREAIAGLAGQAAPALGFTPDVSFGGPVDRVPDEVAGHLLAVCREALSNVARHAGATTATVSLSLGTDGGTGGGTGDGMGDDGRRDDGIRDDGGDCAGGDLILRVCDNGRGIGDTSRSSGLRNMRERAELLGGSFQVTSEQGAGTQLEWRVPLR